MENAPKPGEFFVVLLLTKKMENLALKIPLQELFDDTITY